MKSLLLKLLSISLLVVTIHACKSDDDDDNNQPAPSADQLLLNDVAASGYVYYQGGITLAPASPSPHGSFKLRFNSIAASVLDSTGELPVGGSFPAGSVLVKEVFNGGALDLFAVMKKDPGNANAGSGWVWAEFDSNGAVAFSVTNKGNGCVSCHSGTPNRDLVRTFDLH